MNKYIKAHSSHQPFFQQQRTAPKTQNYHKIKISSQPKLQHPQSHLPPNHQKWKAPNLPATKKKVLRELRSTENNPSTAQEILLAHEAGLSKKQVCSWFGRQRDNARERGENEVASNSTNNPSAAKKLWFAYRFDPWGLLGS